MSYRIAIDSGGTFTDGVLMNDEGVVITSKAHTTLQDLTIGTMNCIARLASETGLSSKELLVQTRTIVHGTTLATNVIATRSGAKMGTITTKGYRLRMTFPQVAKSEWTESLLDMYDFRFEAPKALTRKYLMTEVEERVNAKGEVLIPLNEESVRDAVRYLKQHGVESIAVMLMFSPLYAKHEQRIGEIINEVYPGVYVALSSAVVSAIGEVERWSTTMFSAYVAPATIGYVANIENILKKEGFQGELVFMQSNGGVATPDIVMKNPATILLSGPAAGPALGLEIGKAHGITNIVSVDMGGTSFDVGVVHDGIVDIVELKVIDAKKFNLPSVDVSAIGAGGGSIAFIDIAGKLDVGPKSAGAFPGPACYDQGGIEPTVTDANVVLGYIDPDFFLAGESRLKKDLAEKAIKEQIADPLHINIPEAAAAVYDIVNAKMASSIEISFAKRGYDPRDFALCAAGGAAPLHAIKIAQEIGINKVIVPRVAPVYCAFGMMFSDLKHDFQRSYFSKTADADLSKINELFAEMEKTARETLRQEGVAEEEIIIDKAMDMRYYGQFRQRIAVVPEGTVTKESLQTTISRFHNVHKSTIGYADPGYPTEIVRLHLSGKAIVPRPQAVNIPEGNGDVSRALKGMRGAYFTGYGFVASRVFDGGMLAAGDILDGPCIVEDKFSTFVIPPGIKTEVDSFGNYVTIVSRDLDTVSATENETRAIDPTTFSVVWNKINYIVEEIGQKIIHSTQCYVIANARDVGQTFLNKDGKIVTVSCYLPFHTMVAERAIKGLESTFRGDYEPGDFIIANDPYIVAGGHLPDWNFIKPVFYRDELIGFLQAKGHVSDTGGFLPGGYGPGAYDIIAEGLNIPPLKIIKKGVLQKDLWSFLLRNVRFPTEVDMDTMLINGCMEQAEEQIVALCDKFGAVTVKACLEEIVAAGERAMRTVIKKIPDGTYYGESATDWDGQTDKQIRVRVNVTVKGDEIIFDFSGSDPQATFVNSTIGVTETGAALALFFICGENIPKNGGAMLPLRIIAPEGSVVNPKYPATVGSCQIAAGTMIVESCMLALGRALPEKAMACWCRHLCPVNIGINPDEIDPRTGQVKQYFAETFASDGGSGAVKGFDGWQGVSMQGSAGNFMRPSMEIFELRVPYMVTRYEVLPDWEGAGEFRGSPGTLVEFVAHTIPDATALLLTGNSDGMSFAPSGVAGGGSGRPGEMYIESLGGKRRILRTMSKEPIFPGEKCVIRCSGGGGWGDPLDRDVKKVQDDVVDGLVSIERAREVYGVAIDPENHAIRYGETERLREGLRKKRAGC